MLRRLLAATAAALALHAPARAADTIKVGVMLVDAGPLAFLLPLYTEPAKLAVEILNAQGGALGRKFELVMQAHSGTPAGAIATATKLVQQDGASFLTGFNTTAAVLALGPKLGDTPATAAFLTRDATRAAYLDNIAAGRPAHVDEIAGLIAYLASLEAAYVNGETVYIDGTLRARGYPTLKARRGPAYAGSAFLRELQTPGHGGEDDASR